MACFAPPGKTFSDVGVPHRTTKALKSTSTRCCECESGLLVYDARILFMFTGHDEQEHPASSRCSLDALIRYACNRSFPLGDEHR